MACSRLMAKARAPVRPAPLFGPRAHGTMAPQIGGVLPANLVQRSSRRAHIGTARSRRRTGGTRRTSSSASSRIDACRAGVLPCRRPTGSASRTCGACDRSLGNQSRRTAHPQGHGSLRCRLTRESTSLLGGGWHIDRRRRLAVRRCPVATSIRDDTWVGIGAVGRAQEGPDYL